MFFKKKYKINRKKW